MNTTQHNTGIGEWLFLVGGAGLVGGYLCYENMAVVAGWLAWLQTLDAAPGGWLGEYWGLLSLLAATIFAAYRLRANSNSITVDGAPITYKPLKYVPVKLVR